MFEVTGRGATKGSQEKQSEIGEDEKFGLKPMNCPGHCLLYKSQKRSYRDLPIRYADFSPLHRNEISGALSGLTRGRRFHQDDGHIFCRPSQIGDEINKTLAFVEMVYTTLGMGPYRLVLSTRPEQKFIGDVKEWDTAEIQLKEALDKSGRQWEINPGDGAFYGPKIDIILKDNDNYEHQTATIQLDFQLPQRFGLTYQAPGATGDVKGVSMNDPELLEKPVIIHRAILGSLERFMALLIEHREGYWPFWLSPRQAIILTVEEETDQINYATEIASKLSGTHYDTGQTPRPLSAQTYLIDTDFSRRSISKRIIEAKKKRYNLICVIGRKEAANKSIVVNITGQPRNVSVLKMLGTAGYMDTQEGQSVDLKAIKLNQEQLTGLMQTMCDRYL